MTTPRLILKPKRAQPFFGRHPWVFAGAVAAAAGNPNDGDEIDLYSHTGSFVARGLYNSQSKILARLYSWEPGQAIDCEFFRARLSNAIRLRRDVLKRTGSCRLVFSEADGLSGLTVDRYGDWLAVQFTALGVGRRRQEIAELLAELIQPKGIFLRTERGIGKLEGLQVSDELLWGEPPPMDLTIEEHGLQFRVNLTEGQKTGFYLDQCDNRRAVAELAAGRRMLDGFCYTGGFGLHAARSGATEVLGIDASEPALALARVNAELNGLANVQFAAADVFDELTRLHAAGRRFDLIVLDPPKFARARHAVPEALRGYRRLMTIALRLLDRDGIFVMCCCSGLVTADQLDEVLAQVAVSEKREVQLLAHRGASPDHPVSVFCPETGYLKCLIARAV
jgi:23S rRNA (cytosine1962-C5)-methyltransferase